jgi:preprotein translocase subunit SecY
LFPPIIAQLFLRAKTYWIVAIAQKTIDIFQNQLFYGVFYFVLVVAFTYFYTAIIFHPDKISENLQKQGGFIPGIRPGQATADYLSFVMNRIVFVGALFLGAIAVLPVAMQAVTGTSLLAVGGTSLLIVVAVVIDVINQINAQLSMRDYQ